MDDASLESIPAHNRVSIRAVLVAAGEDPGPALRAAGICDPIAIPVVVGTDPSVPGGILGDGVTANMRALLETEHHHDSDGSPVGATGSGSDTAESKPARPVTTTAPAAFGFRSFAPIIRVGGTGPVPRPAEFASGTMGSLAPPVQSFQVAATTNPETPDASASTTKPGGSSPAGSGQDAGKTASSDNPRLTCNWDPKAQP